MKGVYKFTAIDRTLEFTRALIVEGKYSVQIQAVYEEFPREDVLAYFEVTVEEIKENA